MGIKLNYSQSTGIPKNRNLIQRKLTVYGMVLHTAKPEQKKCYVQNLTWITIRYWLYQQTVRSNLKSITKDTEVGIQSGSTAADAADSVKELKNSKIKLLADNVQILNDLGHGLDAAVMDEVVAKYYTKKDAGKYKVLEDSVAKKNMSLDSEKMTKHFATKL